MRAALSRAGSGRSSAAQSAPGRPADHNVPVLDGMPLPGMQHKYRETVLFFPARARPATPTARTASAGPSSSGSTTSSSPREAADLVGYLREHPEVTSVLFTGGDPMVMRLSACAHTSSRSSRSTRWTASASAPRRRPTGPIASSPTPDADDLLRLFEQVVAPARTLALMAHFSLKLRARDRGRTARRSRASPDGRGGRSASRR